MQQDKRLSKRRKTFNRREPRRAAERKNSINAVWNHSLNSSAILPLRPPAALCGEQSASRAAVDRRGFSVYEMLVVVLLFSILGGIAAPFPTRVVKSMRGARVEATTNAQFDNAIGVLRNNVWQATSMQIVSAHKLLLTQADHRQISWEFTSDLHLQQTDHGLHDWGTISPSVEFAQEGSAVDVKVVDAPHFHGGTFFMACPMLMTAEVKP